MQQLLNTWLLKDIMDMWIVLDILIMLKIWLQVIMDLYRGAAKMDAGILVVSATDGAMP